MHDELVLTELSLGLRVGFRDGSGLLWWFGCEVAPELVWEMM